MTYQRLGFSAAVVTLVGATILHAFTHTFATMFQPLLAMMQVGLGRGAVSQVTLLVTLYGVVYWLLAYPAGLLADRWDRKVLLGIGLLGNAVAIIGIGLTSSYPLVVCLCIMGGVFGSLFHPCANALVPGHFPRSPGTAIGLLGIGSGLGFFAGPFFAGLIARHPPSWSPGVADWQWPFLILGAGGLFAGLLFLWMARETGLHTATRKPKLPPGLKVRTLTHAALIALREFTAVGASVLTAIYMLKALHFDTQKTGRILGVTMLFAAGTNPLIVYLTSGRRRLPAHVLILVLAGGVVATVPWWTPGSVILPLIVFQTLILASSAVSDAGLAERIDPHFRGRVNGIFLTIVGGTAATSPFFLGYAVDLLGERAGSAAAYRPLYLGLGLLVLAGTSSGWSLARLARPVPAELGERGPMLEPA